MTMLDRMRRHRGWLKWSLGIVVVTFVLLYIPAFMGDRVAGGTTPTDAVATINGHTVTVAAYQRLYQQRVQSLRANYGGAIDDKMLQQLGIGQNILYALIEEQAVIAEAERLGITVSDAELRERILRKPELQVNGEFIGDAQYQRLLQSQRPPIRIADFEDEVRHSIMSEKLLAATTGWVRVTDADLDAEYRKRNEKVKVELAVFNAAQFQKGVQATDAEIAAQFAAHADTYRVPEKRRVKFLAVDADALRAKMTATPQEVQAKYEASKQMFSTPEQVRASHILFKTDGKNDDAVQKKAEAVLAKVKAGGDFAALAKQYTEDESGKNNGGDLDYFGRGRMDKAFEDAAFALKVGEVSDLVKSQFGFHIIKVTDKKAAVTKTLAEVSAQVADQVRLEKAQAEAQKLADEVAKEIKTPDDLERVARTRGLNVGDSGLFSREEPMAGLGFAPAVASEAFTLASGKVSGLLRTNQGAAFITVVEVKPSYVPKVDEVKDKVRDDVVRQKAVELAKTKAEAVAHATGNAFASAAKAAGVEVKATDFIGRGSTFPEIGVNPTLDDIVFNLKAGETTSPVPTDAAVVVAHVKERQDIDQTKFLTERDTLKQELIQQQRQQFFGAYMAKAKAKLKISYNEAAIRSVLGG
jgi:peptidyl-prolyl cis-trans isomerase D